MTLIQMAESYIKTAENIQSRLQDINAQLAGRNISPSQRTHLIRRRAMLEDMYWDTRSTGRQLLREYGA